jgi:hypothetical protein
VAPVASVLFSSARTTPISLDRISRRLTSDSRTTTSTGRPRTRCSPICFDDRRYGSELNGNGAVSAHGPRATRRESRSGSTRVDDAVLLDTGPSLQIRKLAVAENVQNESGVPIGVGDGNSYPGCDSNLEGLPLFQSIRLGRSSRSR